MHVKRIKLVDFRNYSSEAIDFAQKRNIIVGQNAQGKTNLLEAIELISKGKSPRTANDIEMIKRGAPGLEIELEYQNSYGDQIIHLSIRKNLGKILKSGAIALEKRIQINGTNYNSLRKLNGNCVTVSFKSEDLNLVRGGPKFRRDWLDSIASTLKKTFSQDLSKYTKAVAQKNRLLKELFEQQNISDEDLEQLKVWNQQAALLGGKVIKQRIDVLKTLLPLAKEEHSRISGSSENLDLTYLLRCPEEFKEEEELDELDEKSIAKRLYRLYKRRHREEIVRRQTLAGPHRDDIILNINGEDATAYASQGQQRSLVLALKLAELWLVKSHILESPILLLDDVLAELDLSRQSYLMAACDQDMQTLITTTHVDAFEKKWLKTAQFIEVAGGKTTTEKCPSLDY